MDGKSTNGLSPAKIIQRASVSLVLLAFIAGAGAILVYVSEPSPANAPRAAHGAIDLSSWDFPRSGPIGLSGDWSFAPSATASAAGPSLVKVPGDWRRGSSGDRTMAEAYGSARYDLTLLRRGGQDGLALLVPDESIAWSLYVDGELRAANGRPGETAATTAVRRETLLVALPDAAETGSETRLSILVSNFSYDVGGLINPISIGPSRSLASRMEAMSILSGFILGGLFVIALYHFFLFALRVDDRSSLYLSLFCFLFMLRSLMTGHYPERLIASGALSGAVFGLSVRMEYLCLFLGIPVYLAFASSLFTSESSRRVLKASFAIGLAFSAIVVATPLPFFMAWTTKPYQAVTVISAIYALAIFSRAVAGRRRGALYGLVGFTAFFLVGVNDILHANLVIRTAHLSPLGLMAFMIAQSLIVSSRIAATFERERLLARELAEEKRLLDRRIEERTAELTATNERLRDIDAAKSRFLATISHELRTPIALIVSPVEQVTRGRYGESIPRDGEIFARLLRSGYRMLNIVEGMFDFARLELGRLAPRLERVGLADALAFYASELESLALKKGVSLSFENRLEGPLAVSMDPRLFEIAFFNVVSNALKFTSRGGSVTIAAAGPGPEGLASISVSDTGIGIAPDLLPRIFDKLDWQADESERLYDGAGIGLSLSKKIIALHGGSIGARSEPGAGSTFTILLPAAIDAPGEGSALGSPSAIGERGRSILGESLEERPVPPVAQRREDGPLVLLVEDNRDLLGFMRERLEERFRVRAAPDGEEALRRLQDGLGADIVVTDVMMPKMDGASLFREAKRLLGDRCPPFVFLTARNDGEERRETLAEGAVDYLAKPFDPEELALRIESILAMRARAGEGARRDVKDALARFLDQGSPERVVRTVDRGADSRRREEVMARLTQREIEIAELASRGLPDKRIAQELGLASRTVSNTLIRIYRKAGVDNRLELMRLLGEGA